MFDDFNPDSTVRILPTLSIIDENGVETPINNNVIIMETGGGIAFEVDVETDEIKLTTENAGDNLYYAQKLEALLNMMEGDNVSGPYMDPDTGVTPPGPPWNFTDETIYIALLSNRTPEAETGVVFMANDACNNLSYYGSNLPILGSSSSQPSLWTPEEIATELWLDADDAATITDTGGFVDQWDDKSGNGRHAVPVAPPASRPLTGNKDINGLNVIDADGGGKWMQSPFPATPFPTDEIHVFQVREVSATNEIIFDLSIDAGPPRIGRVVDVTNFFARNTDGGGFSGTALTNFPDNGDRIIYNRYINNSSLLERYLDGFVSPAEAYTFTNPDFDGTQLMDFNYLFCDITGGNDMLGGLGEYLVVFGPLAPGDRERIEGYLAWKWCLQGKLPAGHPYKSAAPMLTGSSSSTGSSAAPSSSSVAPLSSSSSSSSSSSLDTNKNRLYLTNICGPCIDCPTYAQLQIYLERIDESIEYLWKLTGDKNTNTIPVSPDGFPLEDFTGVYVQTLALMSFWNYLVHKQSVKSAGQAYGQAVSGTIYYKNISTTTQVNVEMTLTFIFAVRDLNTDVITAWNGINADNTEIRILEREGANVADVQSKTLTANGAIIVFEKASVAPGEAIYGDVALLLTDAGLFDNVNEQVIVLVRSEYTNTHLDASYTDVEDKIVYFRPPDAPDESGSATIGSSSSS
jgi:hypothetical protein